MSSETRGFTAAAFARWHDLLAQRLVADGLAQPAATSLAMLVLTSFEGAIVVARASRNPAALDLVQEQLRELIRSQTSPAARKRAPR